jgi:hypothetical protein
MALIENVQFLLINMDTGETIYEAVMKRSEMSSVTLEKHAAQAEEALMVFRPRALNVSKRLNPESGDEGLEGDGDLFGAVDMG